MAVVMRTAEQEEQERQQRAAGMAPLAGARPGMTPVSAAPAGPAGGVQRGGSPGFVGLERYQAANRGATENLGNKVVGQVEGARDAARSALGANVSAFNAGVDQNEVRSDAGLMARFSSDPANLASDASATNAFTRQRDALYQGPRSLDELPSYGEYTRKLADARSTGELTKSESGVSALSDKSVTGPRTTGGRALDTQLLLGDPTLRGRLDAARGGIEGLGGEFDTAAATATERGRQAAETTAKTRTDTRAAITGAQAEFEKQLAARTEDSRLKAFYGALNAQNALRTPRAAIPTAGQQGVYRTFDSFGAPVSDTRGAQAGNVPEFIDYTGGEQMLPAFNMGLAARNMATAGTPPDARVLATLGITPQQWHALYDMGPLRELARGAATGTTNVNPWGFVEEFERTLGPGALDKYTTIANPNVTITNANVANAGDYQRAAALSSLAGPDLARQLLDPLEAGQAGTANLDLVNFDLDAAMRQRAATLALLDQRMRDHIGGNARSGSYTEAKELGGTRHSEHGR